jgi:hypothetical protein
VEKFKGELYSPSPPFGSGFLSDLNKGRLLSGYIYSPCRKKSLVCLEVASCSVDPRGLPNYSRLRGYTSEKEEALLCPSEALRSLYLPSNFPFFF